MKIGTTTFNGRQAWRFDTGALCLTMLRGGGHIAGLEHRDAPGLNPLWAPVWKGLEPWQYDAKKHRSRYGLRLLGSIAGHNLCLGWFGDPSAEEAAAGMEVHGEAPVARWKRLAQSVGPSGLSLTVGCALPVSQMVFTRTLTGRPGSSVIRVRETVTSASRRDLAYTMCQHVTFGPPFLEKGVTVFDMPATRGHTFPGPFSDCMRLRPDRAFRWPVAPGADGRPVNLRTLGGGDRPSSDFTTQLMDPRRTDSWFSALHPGRELMVGYAWKRSDYPWIGNWEESYGRRSAPWAGASLARGMEFANSPFPFSLRRAVETGRFQGESAYRWLPALGTAVFEYSLFVLKTPKGASGVRDIRPARQGFDVEYAF